MASLMIDRMEAGAMWLDVSGDGRSLALRAVEDLQALSVRIAPGADRTAVADLLTTSGAGEMAADHAWVSVAWLRTASGEREQVWEDDFAAMLRYATSHDWLSTDGRRVRAHIEVA
jgi:hypothetical protein